MNKNHARTGYTKIPNRVLTMLKGEDLRAWLIVRSKAPNFVVSFHYLKKTLKVSASTLRRIVASLKAAGMLETAHVPQQNGRPFDSYTAVLPDEPAQTEEIED